MLHHLRSAAADRPEDTIDEDDVEGVRAIAMSDQRTIYLVNMFIANTVEFLNSLAALCDDKEYELAFSRRIVKLDLSLALLEAKLHSIDENNALGHSAGQKAHQCSIDDRIFNPTSLVGESSRPCDI